MPSKNYMGKLYLAPRSESLKVSSPDNVLVYLNFGWVTKGNQQFPAHHPGIMGDAFPQNFQYKELQSSIESFIDQNGMSSPTSFSLITCGMMMPCFCICIYPYLSGKSKGIVKGVQEKVQRFNESHGQKMRVELCEYAQRIELDDLAHDENNKTLSSKDEDGHSYPIWPPVGMNIIFEVRGNRKNWPDLLTTATGATASAYPVYGGSGRGNESGLIIQHMEMERDTV